MRHGKSLLAAVVVLAGLASSASAQGFGVASYGGNAFGGGLGYGGIGGIGLNQGYTGYTGFNGGYTNFGAYNSGYNGFINPYATSYTPRVYPQTQNNMFGLMNTIRTQTGRSNSYRYGYGTAINRRGW